MLLATLLSAGSRAPSLDLPNSISRRAARATALTAPVSSNRRRAWARRATAPLRLLTIVTPDQTRGEEAVKVGSQEAEPAAVAELHRRQHPATDPAANRLRMDPQVAR